MPLEIRELIIKARIDAGETRAEPSIDAEALQALKEQMIQEAVHRLEELIERRGQR